jgi:hypothetical protein
VVSTRACRPSTLGWLARRFLSSGCDLQRRKKKIGPIFQQKVLLGQYLPKHPSAICQFRTMGSHLRIPPIFFFVVLYVICSKFFFGHNSLEFSIFERTLKILCFGEIDFFSKLEKSYISVLSNESKVYKTEKNLVLSIFEEKNEIGRHLEFFWTPFFQNYKRKS